MRSRSNGSPLRASLAITALPALALALSLSAVPASASPMLHDQFAASEAGSVSCGPHTYTFTSGDFWIVSRDPSIAAHLRASDVRATDEVGTVYRVVGGETYNDAKGMLVSKIRFLSPDGGVADSVNIVYHFSLNGTTQGFDHGTCSFA